MPAHNTTLGDIRVRAAAAVCGLACISALATAAVLVESGNAVADSTMQTGVTVTAETPAAAPSITMAVPTITGPAPLPAEEQGLPG